MYVHLCKFCSLELKYVLVRYLEYICAYTRTIIKYVQQFSLKNNVQMLRGHLGLEKLVYESILIQVRYLDTYMCVYSYNK